MPLLAQRRFRYTGRALTMKRQPLAGQGNDALTQGAVLWGAVNAQGYWMGRTQYTSTSVRGRMSVGGSLGTRGSG